MGNGTAYIAKVADVLTDEAIMIKLGFASAADDDDVDLEEDRLVANVLVDFVRQTIAN